MCSQNILRRTIVVFHHLKSLGKYSRFAVFCLKWPTTYRYVSIESCEPILKLEFFIFYFYCTVYNSFVYNTLLKSTMFGKAVV